MCITYASRRDGVPSPAGPAGAAGGPALRADARRNQQRILRAAARLLARDPAASVQRIAEAAEVARPTVYRRYPTRDALVDAILGQAIDDLAEVLRDGRQRAGDPAEVLAGVLRGVAGVAIAYPVLLGARPPAHEHGSGGRHGGRLAAWDDALGQFGIMIARAQARGVVRRGLRPEVLFLSLVGALDLALQPARHSPGEDATAGIADQVVMIFLDGIRAR